MTAAFRNVNELWSSVLVETLYRKGARQAIVCPGSRNSPLTFALARHGAIEAIPALDERSAGFFALGLARRSGRPVVLVCTSGSAVANFFPAMVEASESGVPLLALTADRPPELRACAAGQTIDQVKIFGGFVRAQRELAMPEATESLLKYLRSAVSDLVDTSMGPDRGPAHLNVPFRDPLVPVATKGFSAPLAASDFDAFFKGVGPAVSVSGEVAVEPRWSSIERGLLLVGACNASDSDAWAGNVARLATALGWPVLADALNPIRSRAELFPYLVSGYESILRNDGLKAELAPEGVAVVGGFPTSKALREWIGRMDLPMLALGPRPISIDPTHGRTERILVDFERQSVVLSGRSPSAYARRWVELGERSQARVDARMDRLEDRFEGKLSWLLSEVLPNGSALCVSNSMPPRDLEFYYRANGRGHRVFSSRGANGIDGILSTAMGVAHGGEPTFLLTGDLALLHDSNGALLAKALKGSLTILLVNNGGGGIFEMLPVSQFEDVFEKHFATDQGVDFSSWAKTYGMGYERVDSWDGLRAAVGEASDGARIIELMTDRKADAQRRKAWFAEIAAELG